MGGVGVRVCVMGCDLSTTVVVSLVGVTGWGDPLVARLTAALKLPGLGRLWIRYGDDATEEEVPRTRAGWMGIASMEVTDLLLVEPPTIMDPSAAPPPLPTTAHGALAAAPAPTPPLDGEGDGSGEWLSEEEQNSKRLYELFLSGKCEVRRAMQQVCPHTSTPSSSLSPSLALAIHRSCQFMRLWVRTHHMLKSTPHPHTHTHATL